MRRKATSNMPKVTTGHCRAIVRRGMRMIEREHAKIAKAEARLVELRETVWAVLQLHGKLVDPVTGI